MLKLMSLYFASTILYLWGNVATAGREGADSAGQPGTPRNRGIHHVLPRQLSEA